VDHGKSTLIGRLLYDTDNLYIDRIKEIQKASKEYGKEKINFSFFLDYFQDERKKNITIDTSQIPFKTDTKTHTIIDCPGHVEFIKNMITGAAQADSAVLVVDAKEGVMEQTKRHTFLLNFLGIRHVIVAINKMDLVEYSQEIFQKVKDDTKEFLKHLELYVRAFIPVSAECGDNIASKSDNMKWYDGVSLLKLLDNYDVSDDGIDKGLRLPIQSIITHGDDIVYLGKVESGRIKRGDIVTVSPNNDKASIYSILKFGEELEEAEAGDNVGLKTNVPLKRGDVLSYENDLPHTDKEFQANIFWMSKMPYSANEILTLRLATQECSVAISCFFQKLDSATLKGLGDSETIGLNEAGVAMIKTFKEVVFDKFNYIPEMGRFVLEKDGVIVAGGTII
ncbi:MAG: hypothetical protein HQ594_04630, partial [Candidatus Omnitrophica bacterium]|nr:hypothetical protein [Candidatus Omnitrophota bacterium]